MRGKVGCQARVEHEREGEKGVKGEGKIRKSRRTCEYEVEILMTKSFFSGVMPAPAFSAKTTSCTTIMPVLGSTRRIYRCVNCLSKTSNLT